MTIDGADLYDIRIDGTPFTISGNSSSEQIVFTQGDNITMRLMSTNTAMTGTFNYCTFSSAIWSN